MTEITIKIDPADEPSPTPEPISTTITARLRKTLDGDLVFYDHEDVDIAISAEKRKVFAFPKDVMDDKVYGAQDRLFSFLRKKGLITPESVQGGNYFGSMEASIPESKIEGSNDIQLVLLNVYKFIEEERPEFMTTKYIQKGQRDNEIEPSDKDSTELGDVHQNSQKGSMDPRVRPYGYRYNYSLLRESEKKRD